MDNARSRMGICPFNVHQRRLSLASARRLINAIRFRRQPEMPPVHYTLNGEEPRVIGQPCTGFVLLHFYEGTSISNQVNVAHLKFDEQWYRLYFECGTVFWRESQVPPGMPINSTLEYGLVLNNLSELSSAVGQVLESINYSANEAGDVEVRLGFVGGTAMKFNYSASSDSTRVAA